MFIFNKVFVLFHDNLTFYLFFFVISSPVHLQCLPLLHPPLCLSRPPLPFLQEALEVLVTLRLYGSSVRDVVRMDSQFSIASERVVSR